MNARISARVSRSTWAALDQFARSRGLRKNFVVEQALLLFMEQNRASSRLVLADAEFDELVERLTRPAKPTRALVELMRRP